MPHLTAERHEELPRSVSGVNHSLTETTPLLEAKPTSSHGGRAKPDILVSPYMGGVSVGRFWAIFGLICVTFGIGCFDSTIMASTHPVVTSYFRSSNAASWLSTAFILTSTASQPMMGRLSDALGRKPPFLCGLAVFSFATLWCALAQSMMSFILARAACGGGCGVMVSMSSIMISDMVPIERRGTYQAYINIIYGLGAMLGAATGGTMAEAIGWRWTFGIQVPILLTCLGAAVIVIPHDIGIAKNAVGKSSFEAMKTFDSIGSLLLTNLLVFLILGLVSGFHLSLMYHLSLTFD
jgi:MFS family permease